MRVSWVESAPQNWHVLDMSGADVSCLAVARQWAAAQLDTLGETVKVDAVLVVGELLRRHGDPDEVMVAVADRGTGEPLLRVPDCAGGRGLPLVDAVCAEWGVSHHDDGKVVWGRFAGEDAAP
ncbi:hypothetical protein SAMN05421837_112279 [Amycolatopsis pretoriensis]|uniref:Histidine kinase-like ATPase domain-containing protein n=1 Tax=Amycolatopsis pretoriensis TaxID=218821 RepID=A0A1H5RFI6_9PSEU|nr:ATP-binding protein [Amycolatopsis pretoriensis]SEF37166.1 hypothetical protein SAMN05421837_112279 [Amycolatopsis pretoriensis]